MPATQAGLPFTGSESLAATEASRVAGVRAAGFEAPQLRRLILWLLAREVGDDYLARRDLHIAPASLCARRGQLRWAHVVQDNATWARHEGRKYHEYRIVRLPVEDIERRVAAADALRADRARRNQR